MSRARRQKDKRILTRWTNIAPGDIISFYYKSKNKPKKFNTILVLNPKLKDKDSGNNHLIGLKISEAAGDSVIPKSDLMDIINVIGNVQTADGSQYKGSKDENLYKIVIKEQFTQPWPKGVKPIIYKKLKNILKKFPIYRTYNFDEAKKSIVYLEPITLKGEE